MTRDGNELKLLQQELKNPYQQLNFVFLLTGVIPLLSCIYVLLNKSLVRDKFISEQVPVLLLANSIMLLGYAIGYKIIRNILRKILEYEARAKRSEKLRSGMALALAHDLKGPLSVIKANMANLKAGILGPLAAKQEEMADLCTGVADRTAALLMDLIKTYTLDKGRSELNISRLDLRELVEGQIHEVAAVAETKKIELIHRLSKPALPLNADQSMILRAVNNLLNNAIKFTPNGGKITVITSKTDVFARLEILNTGQSIPEDMLEKIFDNYERLDKSVEGEGLGLAIARGIAEAHHGKLWADSAPGKPNCFTLLLPLAKP